MPVGTGGGGRKLVVGTRRRNVLGRPKFRTARAARKVRQPRIGRARGATVEIENVEEVARAEVERASDAIALSYEEVMVPWFRRIQSDWPVRTGFSKSVLQIHTRQVRDTLVMTIENLASYAFYIRQRWKNPPNAAKRLLWDPSKEIGDRLLQRLGDYIERA